MVKNIYVDFRSKPFDYDKQLANIRNNIVVARDDYVNCGSLYAFTQGLFKSNQRLFVVIFRLKEDGTLSGKHFVREVKDVSLYGDFYIVTWGVDDE